jgi:hypothetical protein
VERVSSWAAAGSARNWAKASGDLCVRPEELNLGWDVRGGGIEESGITCGAWCCRRV